MEKEYNDYQILTPSKMEEITKAYLEAFRSKVNEQNNINIKIHKLFNELYANLKKLKQVCSKHFFYSKQKDINLILNKIEKCFHLLNFLPTTPNNYNHNESFCRLIQSSIFTCAEILKLYMEQNNLMTENSKQEIVLICLNLIQSLPYLLGECKYRKIT